MHIDFVSDVSCPWCAIGLAGLEQALDRVRPDGIHATLQFQPFELNPQMPPEGEEIVGHLSRKYGISAEQVAANTAAIRTRGASVGVDFGLGKRSRIYNTFDAHRLLHWAGLQGGDAQLRLKRALFAAYFTDGENPGEHALLQRLAVDAGLDGARAAAILASDDYADAVRADEAQAHANGIHSVPAVVVEKRWLISGGQPPEVFEQALRQIAAQLADERGTAGEA